MHRRWLIVLALVVGCGGSGKPAHSPEYAGRMERAQIEKEPKWAEARESQHADPEAARALLKVPPGATVRIYFGAWCGDSRREMSRLFDALDLMGKPPPFTIEYIAVDHTKRAPNGLTDGVQLKYVPTFVVIRDEKEVGRIIESSPGGIERDLGVLLRGERTGVISGRSDV